MAVLLTDEEITAALTNLPDWRGSEGALVRAVELADFSTAIRVVNRVAELAESVDHHPDIDIRWRTLTFHLSTHSNGGVTEKDVSLAQQIDETIASV
jgi:4a-hydroxytetrahydrobiopterin dehydratase